MPVAFAHVGHGDEFQAEGGVDRVEMNAETDPLLGIQVNPIEPAADGSGAVMIPVSALVEDNGRQLVFVEYAGFYEPVPVTTGDAQGELIEILEGLSVGEQLVTQGSLSLYAESRKTQTAESPETTAVETEPAIEAPATEVPSVEPVVDDVAAATAEASSGFPILPAAVGLGVVLAVGAFVIAGGKKGSV
ncbi:MAG: cobalt transporter [Cyanobacteria bacterium J06642_11]